MSANPVKYNWYNTIFLGRGLGSQCVNFALSPLLALNNPRFIEQEGRNYRLLTDEQAWQRSYISKIILIEKRLMNSFARLELVKASFFLPERMLAVPWCPFLNVSIIKRVYHNVLKAAEGFIHSNAIAKAQSQIYGLKRVVDACPSVVKYLGGSVFLSLGILNTAHQIRPSMKKNILHLSCTLLLNTIDKVRQNSFKYFVLTTIFTVGSAALIRSYTWHHQDSKELERAQKNHAAGQEKIRQISRERVFPSNGILSVLPPELNSYIFSFVPDRGGLNLAAKWTLQRCFQDAPHWRREILRERLPEHLYLFLRDKLGQEVLDHMPHIKVEGSIAKEPQNGPLDKAIYKPGQWTEWVFPPFETSYLFIEANPLRWPLLSSGLNSHPAPFLTGIKSDMLGHQKVGMVLTPANTLAIIFVYSCTFYDAIRKETVTMDQGVRILQQASPFDCREWLFADLSMERRANFLSPQEPVFSKSSPQPLSIPYARFLVYNEKGELDPECQAGYEWFGRFLDGEKVGWFANGIEDPIPALPHEGCIINFKNEKVEKGLQ